MTDLNVAIDMTNSALLVTQLMGHCAMQTSAVRTNGVDLPYADQGDGQPVVLVHGNISDHRIWDDHREIIARQYRVITPTQRYFGLADWQDDGRNFSIQSHANDLAAFIRALRLGPASIVGWSYGGAVSLAMAAQHPQLVACLFLYEPSLATFITDAATADRAAHDGLEMVRAAKVAAKEGNIDGAVEILMDGVNDHAGDFRRLPERVRSVTRQNSRTLSLLFNAPPPPPISCADLRRLDFPTVVAVGGDSRAFYRIVSKAASQCIPGSRLVEVPNARHLWPVQDPTTFGRLVLDFLDNAERSAKRPPP